MNQTLFAEAVLGKDAEEFLSSDIGRYIIGQCEMEAAEAKDELARIHPWRTRRIRDLQNQVWRAESVRMWLAELVIAGKAAMQVLDES